MSECIRMRCVLMDANFRMIQLALFICILSHTPASTAVSIEKSGRNRTENGLYTARQFVSYVCTPTPLPTDNRAEFCGRADIAELMFCVIKNKLRVELKWCARRARAGTKTHRAAIQVYCLLLPAYYLVLYGQVQDDSTDRMMVFSVCDTVEALQLARKAVQNCQLSKPSRFTYNKNGCRGHLNASQFFGQDQGEMSQILWTKLALTLLSKPWGHFWGQSAQPAVLGCWERDLQDAKHLYDTRGHWDVDDTCVDVIETILTKVVHVTFSIFRRQFDQLNSEGELVGSQQANRIMKTFTGLFITAVEDYVIHRQLLPALARFKSTAGKRSHHGWNRTTTVSCSLLRSNLKNVIRTVLILSRLVLVDTLQHFNFALSTTLWISMLNVPLDCAIHDIV